MDMYNQAVGFRQSLKLLNYWKHKVKELENERDNKLMVINHKMSGLSHAGVELSEEQKKSGKPMPTSSNHGQGIRYVGFIEKKDKVKEEYQVLIEHYQFMIDDVNKVLNRMKAEDRELVMEMYVNHKYTYDYIARSHYTSVSNIKRLANSAINKALLDSEPSN